MRANRFLLIYIVIFLSILTSCTTTKRDDKRAALYHQIGADYLESNNYPEALTNLLKADEHAPNNPVIMNSLGMLYFAQHKYDMAVAYLEKAIQKQPQYSEARNNLGRVYIAQGLYDKAITEINKVIRDLVYTAPEKAKTNLGLAYLRKDQYQLARTQFLEAIKLNKNYCYAYGYYGQTLLKLKEYDNASGVFDRAIKVCQNNPEEVHYLSGLSYYHRGKKKMALIRLKEVTQLYPASEFAEKSRALLNVIAQDTQ